MTASALPLDSFPWPLAGVRIGQEAAGKTFWPQVGQPYHPQDIVAQTGLQAMPSKQDKEDIIERAVSLLATMRQPNARQALMDEFGIKRTAAVTYLRLARERMLGALDNTSRKQERAKTLATLDAIIHDHEARHADRLSACKLRASLLGLNAPVKIIPSAPTPLFDIEEERAALTPPDDAS